MNQPTVLRQCRACGNPDLDCFLKLGDQALTGVFPKTPEEPVTSGPLNLVFCAKCGLVQLGHSYDLSEMYGMNYGYRSGLNASMVRHLNQKALSIESRFRKSLPVTVLDIGSNDGTTLASFPAEDHLLIGFDPTGKKFRHHYRKDIRLVDTFFSAATFRQNFDQTVDLVFSIAMFYDLEKPVEFMRDIASILSPGGVWHSEQSYLPTMFEQNAYDTICHEHLEYYTLTQVSWMAREAGLRVIDVELNAVNGGSFAVTFCRQDNTELAESPNVAFVLEQEKGFNADPTTTFTRFRTNVEKHRADLSRKLEYLRKSGRKVFGYGASTKGNVLLQYCGITRDLLPCIADVNPDKHGKITPGTHIPIVDEAEARAQKPDYFLVLPWHFREHIVAREQDFLQGGGRLIFPLPHIEEVGV
jgi:SAM-dependent methyltransferase